MRHLKGYLGGALLLQWQENDERSRFRSENCSRRDIVADCEFGPEETSPTFPRASNNFNRSPSILPCRTPSSTSPSSRSTPVNVALFTVNARGSCCDHVKQFDALQRKLAVLAEKIDNLPGSSTTAVEQRRSENLPRDMVVSNLSLARFLWHIIFQAHTCHHLSLVIKVRSVFKLRERLYTLQVRSRQGRHLFSMSCKS